MLRPSRRLFVALGLMLAGSASGQRCHLLDAEFGLLQQPSALALGDLDGLGQLDAVVVVDGPLGPQVVVYYDLRYLETSYLDRPLSTRAGDVTVADLDGDTLSDVAVAADGLSFFLSSEGRPAPNSPIGDERRGPCAGATQAIVALELDGRDGLDLILGAADGTLCTALNDGTGSFSTGTPIALPDELDDLHAVDLDDDGDQDLLATGRSSGALWYLENTGRSFAAARRHEVSDAAGVDTGRLSSDPWPDVVVASPTAEEVLVFLGDGDGGLAEPTRVSVPGRPQRVRLGDVDEDGDVDLLVLHATDEVSLVTQEAGTWLESARFVERAELVDGAILDEDGVQGADLFLVASTGAMKVRYNRGGGTFGEPPSPRTIPVGPGPTRLFAGDLTDGGLDSLLSANAGGDVSVILNDGLGQFSPEAWHGISGRPQATLLADVDRDGEPDVVMVSSERGELAVLHGRSGGGFEREQTWPGVADARRLVLADLDGLNGPDLVLAGASRAELVVLLNDGLGGFANRSVLSLDGIPGALVLGALDDDGRSDLAVSTSSPDEVVLLFGRGDGTFELGPRWNTGPEEPRHLALAQLDGAGGLDLVSGHGATVVTHHSLGGRSFEAAVTFDLGAPLRAIATGDVDGIGGVDLGLLVDEIQVALNDGAGAYPMTIVSPTRATDGSQLVLGELDALPGLDAAVSLPEEGLVELLSGDGTGSFGVGEDLFVGRRPRALSLIDLGGEAALIVSNEGTDDLSLLRREPMGWSEERLGTCDDARAVAVLEHDGVLGLDLVVANGSCGDLVFLVNDGDGAFTETERLSLGIEIADVVSADLDGLDGEELVVIDRELDELVVLRAVAGSWMELDRRLVDRDPYRVLATDVDLDDLPDVVLMSSGTSFLSHYRNEGSGVLASPLRYGHRGYEADVVAADLGGTSSRIGPDVAGIALGSGGRGLWIVHSDGAGEFSDGYTFHTNLDGIWGLAALDLDGLGQVSLAMTLSLVDRVEIRVAAPARRGFPASRLLTTGSVPLDVISAELDCEPGQDLATADSGSDRISIFGCDTKTWLLRNDSATSLSQPELRAALELGLSLTGPDGLSQAGEGGLESAPGSGDDDQAYVPSFVSGEVDPDPTVLLDAGRPLVFYRLSEPQAVIHLSKTADGFVRVVY